MAVTNFYITATGQSEETLGAVLAALQAAGLVITGAYTTIFAEQPGLVINPPFQVEILADVEVKVFDAAGGGFQKQTRRKGDKMTVITIDPVSGWWEVWINPPLWVSPDWKLYQLVK